MSDPVQAQAVAAYLAEIPAYVRAAAARQADAAVLAWVLGWAGAVLGGWLLLRSRLLERIGRRGEGRGALRGGVLAVMAFAGFSACVEVVARAPATGLVSLAALAQDVVWRALLVAAVYAVLALSGRRPRLGFGLAAVGVSFALVFGPVAVSELTPDTAALASGPVATAAWAVAAASGVSVARVEISAGAPGEGDVVGLLKPARILLTPTAAAHGGPAEVAAAVGHVLGHYRHHDEFGWAVVLGLLGAGGGVFIAGLYRPLAKVLGAEGVERLTDPRGLPVLWMLAATWLALAEPLAFAFDRHINMAADRFSLKHAGAPDGLAEALVRENGLAPVDPTWLQEWVACTHPGLKTRLAQAMAWKAGRGGGRGTTFP